MTANENFADLKQCLERKRKYERYKLKVLGIDQGVDNRIRIWIAGPPASDSTMETVVAPCGYRVNVYGFSPARGHYLLVEKVGDEKATHDDK